MNYRSFSFFATTADTGLHVEADSRAALAVAAAEGLCALLFPAGTPARVRPALRPFEYRGDSLENSLVNLLGEILYLAYEKGLAVPRVEVLHLRRGILRCRLITVPAPVPPALEIKSVTYHRLALRWRGQHCEIDFVLDV
ncbi:MAG TPA: archease [Candidatus Aminicenantes bacterium]|nr:archease [Candidatus Aminicenantes bacterium]